MGTIYAKRAIIAASGLFLCLFLVVHLSANALLLLPEDMARGLYNGYSNQLRESLLIKGVAYLLYLSIVLHVAYALVVTLRNRSARRQGYVVHRPSENSTWTSQNMGLLGLTVAVFLVVHLANFWARIKLGLGAPVGLDADGHVDVYEVTKSLFSNGYFVLFYTGLMVPLGLHLHHGLASACRTLGFHHRRGTRALAKVSSVYAGVMAVGFAVIPGIVYLR